MQNKNTISCPNCGTSIDIDEVLFSQVKEQLNKEYNTKLSEQKKEYESKYAQLTSEQEKLKTAKQLLQTERNKMQEEVEANVNTRVKEEKQKIEKQLRDKLTEEQADEMKTLKEELTSKSEKLRDFNKAKAEIERLKREKDDMKAELELEAEKKLSEQIRIERESIRKKIEDENELKLNEKDHQLNQLREQLKEANRKAEQGSMQMQGEVQELAIEEFLKENFPLDKIEEIKKGARGADCVQIVNTRTAQDVGKIYYESKRTKDFQRTWIEKFRADMREKNADIGVLVTEAMPADMDRMGQRDGIWICTFSEFKGLSFVLRDTVVQISNAIATQENKGDKMSLLYDFLTGNEFRLQIEAIVEGFTQMQEDLESEKRAFQTQWKKREKQIQKVLLSTNNMYGSIRGIAGNAIKPVKSLELPGFDEPEIDESGQAKLNI